MMRGRLRTLAAILFTAGGLTLLPAVSSTTAVAESATLNNWHVHDCVAGVNYPTCPFVDAAGVNHQKEAGFHRILGVSLQDYLQDPAACPNATDKAFLPGGLNPNQPLRAGVCMTSTTIIHMRSIDPGDPAPDGWTLWPMVSPYVTYYKLDPIGG